MSGLTITVCDGHFMRLVEIRRIEEGTVGAPRYRVAIDENLPVSEAAREYLDGLHAEEGGDDG